MEMDVEQRSFTKEKIFLEIRRMPMKPLEGERNGVHWKNERLIMNQNMSQTGKTKIKVRNLEEHPISEDQWRSAKADCWWIFCN